MDVGVRQVAYSCCEVAVALDLQCETVHVVMVVTATSNATMRRFEIAGTDEHQCECKSRICFRHMNNVYLFDGCCAPVRLNCGVAASGGSRRSLK